MIIKNKTNKNINKKQNKSRMQTNTKQRKHQTHKNDEKMIKNET